MVSLTVRNIPEEILKRIRIFAVRERRSLNSEILIMLENGLAEQIARETGNGEMKVGSSQGNLSFAARETLWRDFAGQWKDERSLQEIITDTYSLRDGVQS